MNIKDLNTDNKTITLPMSEYIKLVEENESSDCKKYKELTQMLLKGVNRIQYDLSSTIDNNTLIHTRTYIDNVFKHNFKLLGYEVGIGTINKIN